MLRTILQTQKFWLALALFAVLLRAFIPAGYMPDFAARGGTIAIKICTGAGHETINVAADKYGKTAPKHAMSICDYAINHVFSPVADGATILFIALVLIFAGYFLREFGFCPRRYFGCVGPRAPPGCA